MPASMATGSRPASARSRMTAADHSGSRQGHGLRLGGIGGATSFSHGKAIGAGADSDSSDSRPASSLCPDEVCGYLLMCNPMVRFTMVSARSRSKDVLQ